MSLRQAQSIVGFRPEGRPDDDFYPTSPQTTQALLGRVIFDGEIWECACGRGDMSKVLESHGYYVISTDLNDYGYGQAGVDFLKTTKLLAPNIVTNPPFKLAEKFLLHGIQLKAERICLLLKLSFLEGAARRSLFKLYPPSWVHVFSKRILLTRNGEKPRGSGMIAFAWFEWEKGFSGNPKIDWI